MIESKIIDLNDEEHRCCEAWKGRGPMSSNHAPSDERLAERSDRTSASGGTRHPAGGLRAHALRSLDSCHGLSPPGIRFQCR